MPIYEYECDSCGKQCEIIQKYDDEPLSICTDCGGHMHKLISQTSFILKGTGWYVTDYASAERKKAKESEGNSKTKTQAKSESGSQTKTETKTETKTDAKTDAASKN